MKQELCPICGAEVIGRAFKRSEDDEINFHCPNACYSEYDGFGNMLICIEGKSFSTHYKMSWEKMLEVYRQIDLAIAEAKESMQYVARILENS